MQVFTSTSRTCHCGKEFVPKRSFQKFCTEECGARLRAKHHKRKISKVPCACGCGTLTHVGYYPGHDRSNMPVEYLEEDHGYATCCWIWQGAKSEFGYGLLFEGKKILQAYRVYYEKKYGPLPNGLEPDHLCRVPSCVNPDHLEPVTHAVNIQRSQTAVLTPKQVEEIYQQYKTASKKYGMQSELARNYGVTPPTVRAIVMGRTWKGVVTS